MKIIYSFFTLLAFVVCSLGQSAAPEFRGEFREGLTPATLREHSAAISSLARLRTSWEGKLTVRVNLDDEGNVTEVVSVVGPGDVCPGVTRADIVEVRRAAANAAKLIKAHAAKISSQPTPSFAFITFAKDLLPTPPESDASSSDYQRTTAAPTAAVASSSTSERTVGHASLTTKALSLPKPAYPAAARALRAQGAVDVRVLVDTDGSVFSAVAVSGHPLLRSAARTAACEAKFTPTLLSGQPVRFYNSVKYTFAP